VHKLESGSQASNPADAASNGRRQRAFVPPCVWLSSLGGWSFDRTAWKQMKKEAKEKKKPELKAEAAKIEVPASLPSDVVASADEKVM
jgi:hypothetical protein